MVVIILLKKINKKTNNMNLTINSWLGDKDNAYLRHIEKCRNKKYPPEEVMQRHHIVPRHWISKTNSSHKAFCESKENLIMLSKTDHIKAHELLYEIYKHRLDKASVLFY
jgi:hypothetical protein